MQSLELGNHVKKTKYLLISGFAVLIMLPVILILGFKKNVPVYMYHSILEIPFDKNESLFVRPDDFEQQIKFLNENGFSTIYADELPQADKYKKPVVITFDDGYDDNYTYAFPALKKYGAKATIFVISNYIGKPHYLTQQQIAEMSESGLVSIQSHTASHLELSKCTDEEIDNEFSASKQALENITNKEVNVISYPFGKYNKNVVEKAKKYFKLGFITFGSKSYKSTFAYETPRAGVFRSTDLEQFKTITFERSRNRFENIFLNIKKLIK